MTQNWMTTSDAINFELSLQSSYRNGEMEKLRRFLKIYRKHTVYIKKLISPVRFQAHYLYR
jgi:hypothetical protein